jgi:arginyl-tRNA synthetase
MMIFDHAALRQYFRQQVIEIFDADPGSFKMEYPPNVELGDLAMSFPFALAKQLRRAPRQIAQEVIDKIAMPEGVKKMEAAGAGYVNLFFDRQAVVKFLLEQGGKDLPVDNTQANITVEHSSINPNKAAHIGHLRNSTLGDSLARLLRFIGKPITVQNYIDDTGVQVADVVVAFMHILKMNKEDILNIAEPFDHFCWDLYSKVSAFYAEDESRLQFKKDALHSMETGVGEAAELGDLIANRVLHCHLKTMQRLDIDYDLLIWEGDILKHKFWDLAFQLMKDKGVIYLAEDGEKKGCWVMDLSKSEAFAKMDDPDKIIVRSNGTVTYVGKDIAYHLWKFGLLGEEFDYSKYVVEGLEKPIWTSTSKKENLEEYSRAAAGEIYNVIDVGQEYPQKVVRECIRAIGGEEAAANYHHFSYEKVALTPSSCQELGVELTEEEAKKPYIAMSGRRGLGVKADDMVEMLITKASAEVKKRNPDFTDDQITEASTKIAIGALRYYTVKFTRNQVLAFDFDTALSFEGDSGPYLMYALVRANNIFAKLGDSGADLDRLLPDIAWKELESGKPADDIWALVIQLCRMQNQASDTIRSLELSSFAKYSYTIAQIFNGWYHKYPIVREENEQLKNLRIVILHIFRDHFAKALLLMGIEAPKRM